MAKYRYIKTDYGVVKVDLTESFETQCLQAGRYFTMEEVLNKINEAPHHDPDLKITAADLKKDLTHLTKQFNAGNCQEIKVRFKAGDHFAKEYPVYYYPEDDEINRDNYFIYSLKHKEIIYLSQLLITELNGIPDVACQTTTWKNKSAWDFNLIHSITKTLVFDLYLNIHNAFMSDGIQTSDGQKLWRSLWQYAIDHPNKYSTVRAYFNPGLSVDETDVQFLSPEEASQVFDRSYDMSIFGLHAANIRLVILNK